MVRKKEQIDLIFKLGLLLSPLYDIINHPENHTVQTRSRAGAKFFHDLEPISRSFREFTKSELGHQYNREYTFLIQWFDKLGTGVERHLDNIEELSKLLDDSYDRIRETLLGIPVPLETEILEANTPFRSYCMLNDLFQSPVSAITLVDAYLDASVFYRYLRDLPLNICCILVTKPQSDYKAPARWEQLIDISRLFAAERNSSGYTLITNQNIHDRWLRIDDQIYALGGSIKDAGKKNSFTITEVTPSAKNREKIDDIVNSGTELFGPNQPVHP